MLRATAAAMKVERSGIETVAVAGNGCWLRRPECVLESVFDRGAQGEPARAAASEKTITAAVTGTLGAGIAVNSCREEREPAQRT